jgi:hypothetical protein
MLPNGEKIFEKLHFFATEAAKSIREIPKEKMRSDQ